MEGGQRREEKKCPVSIEFGEATCKKATRAQACSINSESGLMLLNLSTLKMKQLTPFGSKSWAFVIYNKFSAVFLSPLNAVFIQPKKPLVAFLCSTRSLTFCGLPVSSSGLAPCPSLHALQSPIKCTPAVHAVGTVYQSTGSESP